MTQFTIEVTFAHTSAYLQNVSEDVKEKENGSNFFEMSEAAAAAATFSCVYE